MTKISKPYNKRTSLYEENEDRRVRNPDWNFTKEFINKLRTKASSKKVSVSKYFERVTQNFFLLESPNVIIASKNAERRQQAKHRSPVMSLHPQVIEEIKHCALLSNISASVYIELLFARYEQKYQDEIELKNLIRFF